jgi:hypothetical protein
VANSDWCASRSTTSVMPSGLFSLITLVSLLILCHLVDSRF